MKFTETEIYLCRQIAKEYRKEIKYGDWFYSEYLKEILCHRPFINSIRDHEIVNRDKKVTPLWTIEDCLELLRRRNFIVSILGQYPDDKTWLINIGKEFNDKDFHSEGKTALEACLKPILEVLKTKNKRVA